MNIFKEHRLHHPLLLQEILQNKGFKLKDKLSSFPYLIILRRPCMCLTAQESEDCSSGSPAQP